MDYDKARNKAKRAQQPKPESTPNKAPGDARIKMNWRKKLTVSELKDI
jgi:hypothetical protein